MKVQVSSICKENKIQKSESKNRTKSIVSAVHRHYATEYLLASTGLIEGYITTTLTLNIS